MPTPIPRQLSALAALTCATIAFGCATPLPEAPPGSAWIAWRPRDPELLRQLDQSLRKADLWDERDFALEFDPLSVVPDSRFRTAFEEIEEGDERIHHCQMGSTASGVATIRFTPEVVSMSEVRLKNLRCRNDDELSASLCEFYAEPAFHLDDPVNFFRVHEAVPGETALQLMELLADGQFTSEIEGFPPSDWPIGWASDHRERFLSLDNRREAVAGQYALSLPGCGCSQILIFRFDESACVQWLTLVDHYVMCI